MDGSPIALPWNRSRVLLHVPIGEIRHGGCPPGGEAVSGRIFALARAGQGLESGRPCLVDKKSSVSTPGCAGKSAHCSPTTMSPPDCGPQRDVPGTDTATPASCRTTLPTTGNSTSQAALVRLTKALSDPSSQPLRALLVATTELPSNDRKATDPGIEVGFSLNHHLSTAIASVSCLDLGASYI